MTESDADDSPVPIPRTGDPTDVLRVASEAAACGALVVMATVVARRGSTPSTPGQKLLLADDGTCVGTVGGGAVEHSVLAKLQESMELLRQSAGIAEGALVTFKLGAELGMCCGGSVDILVETISSAMPLLIVGGGHIGQTLAPLAAQAGFVVTVVDDRDDWGKARATSRETRDQPDVNSRVQYIVGEFTSVGHAIGRRGVALAMTHDHQLDQRVIEWALREKFAFVGGVGSRAKATRTRARLEMKGFSLHNRDRIRMPIGVDIGARTPMEIAISITAELIAWRRGLTRPARASSHSRPIAISIDVVDTEEPLASVGSGDGLPP